jgi:hypothetical protein
MFSSGFQEANQREIVVRDWSHAVFLLMMEYLYTGKEPPGLSKYVPTPVGPVFKVTKDRLHNGVRKSIAETSPAFRALSRLDPTQSFSNLHDG